MAISYALPMGVIIFLCWAAFYASYHHSYKKAYWFFEFCHFSAGFFVATFLANIFQSPTLIIFGTLSVGIIWELWEVMRERSKYLKKLFRELKMKQEKMTWSDTVLDLALDIAGALIYVIIVFR